MVVRFIKVLNQFDAALTCAGRAQFSLRMQRPGAWGAGLASAWWIPLGGVWPGLASASSGAADAPAEVRSMSARGFQRHRPTGDLVSRVSRSAADPRSDQRKSASRG